MNTPRTAPPPLSTFRGVRTALLNAAIELEALANRTHYVSVEHRPHAEEIREHAQGLASLLATMSLPPEDRRVLKDFFGTSLLLGRPKEGYGAAVAEEPDEDDLDSAPVEATNDEGG